MGSSGNLDQAVLWGRIAITFFAFTWVSFYHFAHRYSGIAGWPPRLLVVHLYLVVIIALAPTDLIIDSVKEESYGNTPIWGALFWLFAVPLYFLVLFTITLLNRVRMLATSYEERNRLLYFIVGGLLVCVGGIVDLVISLKTDIYLGTTLASILFVLLTGAAILRHQLFDIQLTTHKITPYLVMLVLVGSTYTCIYFALHDLWEEGMEPIWLHLFFVFLISLGVQPVWGKIQYWTIRFFYRGRYEHFLSLKQLHEEAQRISDPSATTTSLPQLIKQAMQATHIYLLLPSPSTDEFEVAPCKDSVEMNSQLSLGRDNHFIRHLENKGEFLHRGDPESFSVWRSLPINERKALEETSGEIFVPLKSGDRLVGLLILGPRVDGRPYSWEDERLLEQIASQMALTIENIQLYQASLSRERQLAVLDRLNHAMNVSLDFESIYDAFANELKKIISVDWASIVLSEGDKLHFFALSTAIDSSWGQPGTIIPVAGTATEWVTLNKKALMEPDLAKKRLFWTGDIHLNHGIRSMVYLPLFSKGEIIGCFIVGSSTASAYTQGDIEFLEQASNHLSLMMENARLYSRERGERAKLEAVNKQRDEFFGIISHELKTPLTSIKSSSELLSEELRGDKQASRKRLIENIRRSTDKLETMLNDLLDIAKARSASLEVNLRPIDLVPVLNSAMDICILPIEQKQQSLEVDIPKTLPPVIADPESFEHIITNLLGNSNKFTPRGGEISLKVRVDGNRMVIEVRDSGPGIPEEEQELIFEPFYRGEFSTGSTKGMGIGLATVKQMVDLHGGTVWAMSEVGKGSTFTVSLPVI